MRDWRRRIEAKGLVNVVVGHRVGLVELRLCEAHQGGEVVCCVVGRVGLLDRVFVQPGKLAGDVGALFEDNVDFERRPEAVGAREDEAVLWLAGLRDGPMALYGECCGTGRTLIAASCASIRVSARARSKADTTRPHALPVAFTSHGTAWRLEQAIWAVVRYRLFVPATGAPDFVTLVAVKQLFKMVQGVPCTRRIWVE